MYYSADKAVIKELNAAEKAGTINTVIAEKLAAGKIKVLTAKTDYTVSGGKNIFVMVRLAAHVSNGLKSQIRPVVGRI
ncbi:MAG: hypothetical protein ACI4TA_01075 [Acetatifactor sp.]